MKVTNGIAVGKVAEEDLPLNYIQNNKGYLIVFSDEETAKAYLFKKGYTNTEINSFLYVNVKYWTEEEIGDEIEYVPSPEEKKQIISYVQESLSAQFDGYSINDMIDDTLSLTEEQKVWAMENLSADITNPKDDVGLAYGFAMAVLDGVIKRITEREEICRYHHNQEGERLNRWKLKGLTTAKRTIEENVKAYLHG